MVHDNSTGGMPTNIPLTMSSIEIAGLCGKRHDHVLRDADKMLAELGITDPKFGASYKDPSGRTLRCLNLPKRETLILVSGYSTELRARIIDRWMQLEAAIIGPVGDLDLSGDARRVVGGIVKAVVHSEIVKAITESLPALLKAEIASRSIATRAGKTAGQIWHHFGYPKMRLGGWFGNRLAAFGCQIEGEGRGELGTMRARLFDPDKAERWIKSGGGSAVIRQKIAERQGQGAFKLVQLKEVP